MTLNTTPQQLCEQGAWDFSDLHAVFIRCTLKG
jgi:hypothetical protein